MPNWCNVLFMRWASRAFLTESRLLRMSSIGMRRRSLIEWPAWLKWSDTGVVVLTPKKPRLFCLPHRMLMPHLKQPSVKWIRLSSVIGALIGTFAFHVLDAFFVAIYNRSSMKKHFWKVINLKTLWKKPTTFVKLATLFKEMRSFTKKSLERSGLLKY